jgi:hypothetical protein
MDQIQMLILPFSVPMLYPSNFSQKGCCRTKSSKIGYTKTALATKLTNFFKWIFVLHHKRSNRTMSI